MNSKKLDSVTPPTLKSTFTIGILICGIYTSSVCHSVEPPKIDTKQFEESAGILLVANGTGDGLGTVCQSNIPFYISPACKRAAAKVYDKIYTQPKKAPNDEKPVSRENPDKDTKAN